MNLYPRPAATHHAQKTRPPSAHAGRPCPNYTQSSGGVPDHKTGPHLSPPSLAPFAPARVPNLHRHAPFAHFAPLRAPIGPIRRQRRHPPSGRLYRISAETKTRNTIIGIGQSSRPIRNRTNSHIMRKKIRIREIRSIRGNRHRKAFSVRIPPPKQERKLNQKYAKKQLPVLQLPEQLSRSPSHPRYLFNNNLAFLWPRSVIDRSVIDRSVIDQSAPDSPQKK